jgi:hypothetical protein
MRNSRSGIGAALETEMSRGTGRLHQDPAAPRWRSPLTSRHVASACKASFFRGSLELLMTAEQPGLCLRISRTVCGLPERRPRAKFRHLSAARRPANPIPAFDPGEAARFPGHEPNATISVDRSCHENRQSEVLKRMIGTSGCSILWLRARSRGTKPIEPERLVSKASILYPALEFLMKVAHAAPPAAAQRAEGL